MQKKSIKFFEVEFLVIELHGLFTLGYSAIPVPPLPIMSLKDVVLSLLQLIFVVVPDPPLLPPRRGVTRRWRRERFMLRNGAE